MKKDDHGRAGSRGDGKMRPRAVPMNASIAYLLTKV